ncbi:hypothetical protein FPOAC1_003800 [Fusarium poae]|jgi:hypothetical protein|uniref:hypothetical protein n=1 Tax=Fusarium poae TaxID=36050 RepID=UPI001CEA5297|nr:hypothetical protein FPOAC1_003800 [Fusarium poae]KAG8677772.1 hypothetical protein FPOAC1_003800 [Fusarium poae]
MYPFVSHTNENPQKPALPHRTRGSFHLNTAMEAHDLTQNFEYGLNNEGNVSFGIPLTPQGDKGSGFHTQNDPNSPNQRENVIERKSAVDIRCSTIDIIHGFFASEGKEKDVFSTLLVLQFRFDPRKQARRISHVDIELRFSGKDRDPEVFALSPNSNLRIAPMKQTETTTTGGELNVSVGGAGANVGSALKRNREVQRETSYAASLVGSIDLRGRNYGKANCASWTLIENPETKAGVPVSMKTAVLLKRNDEDLFQCMVTLKAKADWKTSLEWLVGATPPDDPVLFDPTMDPTSNRYQDMEEKLGDLDLDAICDITSENIVEGSVKTTKMGVLI